MKFKKQQENKENNKPQYCPFLAGIEKARAKAMEVPTPKARLRVFMHEAAVNGFRNISRQPVREMDEKEIERWLKHFEIQSD